MSTNSGVFNWESRSMLILVVVATTLGLNDFLTFPSLVGENGGGLFLILYSLFLCLLSLPMLMGELLLGRISRTDPAAAFEMLAEQHKAAVYWKLVGLLSMSAAFLLVSTMCVVAGWSISYLVKAAIGLHSSLLPAEASSTFQNLILDSEKMLFWHGLFLVCVVATIAQPVAIGVQKSFKYLLLAMLTLLLFVLILAIFSGGMEQSVVYLLYFDSDEFTARTPLLALERAFFTLMLGLGAIMAIGRYIPPNTSISYSAILVVITNLLFVIFASLAINALIFSVGMTPGSDNQSMFEILPVVFASYDADQSLGPVFYLMLLIAAYTTAVALLISPVDFLQRKYQISRLRAACIIGVCCWLTGLMIVLSYSLWNGEGFSIAILVGDEAIQLVNDAGFHDIIIYMASHVIQPLMALLACLFVGWILPREIGLSIINGKKKIQFEIWNYLMRYITPVLIFIVLLTTTGAI
ncbi:MAG: NSS family neurotransmitter:Na+ symporter [Gammaproteobacteria bacterium]|jgi:NSS family neurotransmitter:Na+ symporter